MFHFVKKRFTLGWTATIEQHIKSSKKGKNAIFFKQKKSKKMKIIMQIMD